MNKNNQKPTNTKSYGSIPHLPGSRMGPGDHKCPEGCLNIVTKTPRKHDIITITEKIDGSCCAVACVNGDICATTRSGYLATTSPYEQHHMFARWVRENYERFEFLRNGYDNHRIVGEWVAMAHGTVYDLNGREPFVPFDIIDNVKNKRINYEIMKSLITNHTGLSTPHLIHTGPMEIQDALKTLGEFGQYGAKETVEGIVYRVETNGVFNFICKYVRPEKVDGKYLPEISGNPAIWNWNFK